MEGDAEEKGGGVPDETIGFDNLDNFTQKKILSLLPDAEILRPLIQLRTVSKDWKGLVDGYVFDYFKDPKELIKFTLGLPTWDRALKFIDYFKSVAQAKGVDLAKHFTGDEIAKPFIDKWILGKENEIEEKKSLKSAITQLPSKIIEIEEQDVESEYFKALLNYYNIRRFANLSRNQNFTSTKGPQHLRPLLLARDSATIKLIDLAGANLINTDLKITNLEGANLDNATLSAGVVRDLYNSNHKNFKKVALLGVNLQNMDLSDVDFTSADFSGANLQKTILSGSMLLEANFGKADLNGVNLESANLSGADFRGANLHGANLKNAILDEVKFFHAFDSESKTLDKDIKTALDNLKAIKVLSNKGIRSMIATQFIKACSGLDNKQTIKALRQAIKADVFGHKKIIGKTTKLFKPGEKGASKSGKVLLGALGALAKREALIKSVQPGYIKK